MKNDEQKKPQAPKNNGKEKETIATRKSCAADGVGLSHYILMDKKSK